MRELREILGKLESLPPEELALIATVIDVKGSSYRLPGAKMLIREDGSAYGTVSGGCLEADLIERARAVLQTNKPTIIEYDTESNSDSVFGFNMGCRGIIKILLEPANNVPYIEFLQKGFNELPGVALTKIRADHDIAREYFYKDSPSIDSSLYAHSIHAVFEEQRSVYKTLEDESIFLEYVEPAISIIIFGAGADAIPLAEITTYLGWNSTVIDHRPALLNEERFHSADQLILLRSDELNQIQENVVANVDAAIVMTHNFEYDKQIISFLSEKTISYVGLLGPRKRTDALLNELDIDSRLMNLFAPIGLDIGARQPEMIAIAIIAEIQSSISGRNGGFLKLRKNSIYGNQ